MNHIGISLSVFQSFFFLLSKDIHLMDVSKNVDMNDTVIAFDTLTYDRNITYDAYNIWKKVIYV